MSLLLLVAGIFSMLLFTLQRSYMLDYRTTAIGLIIISAFQTIGISLIGSRSHILGLSEIELTKAISYSALIFMLFCMNSLVLIHIFTEFLK